MSLKYKSSVAPRIRELIKEKGLKQTAIADKAGYEPIQVSQMLCGHRVITDNDCIRIAKAMCVPVAELFADDN